MIRAALLAAALLAAPPAGAATCFDGQLPPAAWAETAARAAVRVVAALPDGRSFANASGIVVADSGDDAHATNRILTAAHVADLARAYAGAWLAVYSSRGLYLGRAEVTARASPGPAFGLAGREAIGLRFGDAAVLAMTAFVPGGRAAYAAITGVKLAPRQPRGLLRGDFSVPAGIDHGVSGSGVVADGQIVGVIAAKELDDTMRTVTVRGGDARDGTATPRPARLPRQATGYAQPVIDTGLLAGLGRAGRTVTRFRGTGRLAVFVPGFVQDVCVGFRASLGPA